MKRSISMMLLLAGLQLSAIAQQNPSGLEPAVNRLDNATTVKEYEKAAADFQKIAESAPTNWLCWYYAAFCNAKIGWLYQEDPDRIEPYANLAEEQIGRSLSLLDTSQQKKELSEVYCILAMANKARVFMNPSVYGRQYGPKAISYVFRAQKADPENPRAQYLLGWEKFYAPKAYGGDKAVARKWLEEAKQKLESGKQATLQPHWGKTEVQALLKQLH